MPGLVYELMDTLEAQIVHFDELIAFSAEKKDVIINNETEALTKLTAGENAAANKLSKLDKARVSLMGDIANVVGRPEGVTLTELCDLMKEQPEHGRLIELTSLTKEKLDSLKALNDQNKVLIENSLDYINFTINAVRGSMLPEQAIYSSDGEELGVRQSFFDARQ